MTKGDKPIGLNFMIIWASKKPIEPTQPLLFNEANFNSCSINNIIVPKSMNIIMNFTVKDYTK